MKEGESSVRNATLLKEKASWLEGNEERQLELNLTELDCNMEQANELVSA